MKFDRGFFLNYLKSQLATVSKGLASGKNIADAHLTITIWLKIMNTNHTYKGAPQKSQFPADAPTFIVDLY